MWTRWWSTRRAPPGSRATAGYVSGVSVAWTVIDPESAIASQPGCETVQVREDTAGMTLTCEATSSGGTASQSVTIKRDATPPVVTATRTPPPNALGWNNTDVSVTFTCTDALSGVAACPAPRLITTEGAGQFVTGQATDQAGNLASLTVNGVSIDKTPPVVSCAATPAMLWPPDRQLVPVSVAVVVDDGLSGRAGFVLKSAASNEPDSNLPGDPPEDVQGFGIGTSDTTGLLRAERLPAGTGRVYTLVYEGSDLAGNGALCPAAVEVPWNRAPVSGGRGGPHR